MFDMMKMMGKVKELQDKMKVAQESLIHITAEGESGGGMVKAIVNGKKQVVSVEVDKDMFKPDDQEMVQDLIVAAINNALESVDVLAKQEIKKSTQGIIPDIPGFDLGSML